MAGMIRGRLIRRAMVLAPKTLLGQWVKELTLCGLGSRVFEYYGTSTADRCETFEDMRLIPTIKSQKDVHKISRASTVLNK